LNNLGWGRFSQFLKVRKKQQSRMGEEVFFHAAFGFFGRISN
jgi:hypothetical protein